MFSIGDKQKFKTQCLFGSEAIMTKSRTRNEQYLSESPSFSTQSNQMTDGTASQFPNKQPLNTNLKYNTLQFNFQNMKDTVNNNDMLGNKYQQVNNENVLQKHTVSSRSISPIKMMEQNQPAKTNATLYQRLQNRFQSNFYNNQNNKNQDASYLHYLENQSYMNARKIDRGTKQKGQKSQRTTGPVMSANSNFEVKGAVQERVIENYQDVTFAQAEENPVPVKNGIGSRIFKYLNRKIDTDLPEHGEGNWGYVQRVPIVAANWGSKSDLEFINTFTKEVLNKVDYNSEQMQICVAPADILISEVSQNVSNNINVMSQNISQYDKDGEFTGNITADMLKNIGVTWALTGISDRRSRRTTDEEVAKKTKMAIEKGMNVIACIGEGEKAKDFRDAQKNNRKQLKAISKELQPSQWGNVVIAYEPSSKIQAGRVDTALEAQQIIFDIRSWLADNVSTEVAGATRILYAGQTDGSNCWDLIQEADIDGFLVSGKALTRDFEEIIQAVDSHETIETNNNIEDN